MDEVKSITAVWEELPGTTDFYFRPHGVISVARATEIFLPLGGSGLATPALTVIAAEAGERLFDEIVPASMVAAMGKRLPEGLRAKFHARLDYFSAPRKPLVLPNGQELGFSKPLVMGVLNVTPDSFSDGGKFVDTDAAIAHGLALIKGGADILDIGGESTRPGAKPLWEGDEIDRIRPVIEALSGAGVPISVDTRKAPVMAAAFEAGATIINDVSALTFDEESLSFAAASGAPVILMHSLDDPQTMQDDPEYADVLLDIFDYLQERIDVCMAAGIKHSQIVVDPGVGFGKTVRHNLELVDGIGTFRGLGVPVLLGSSRKRFIGALSGENNAKRRVPGSLVAALHGIDRGADIIRMHDVAETRQALAVRQGLLDISFLAP